MRLAGAADAEGAALVAAAEAASESLLLCLRSLGRYEVSEASAPLAHPDDQALAAYALDASLDYLVYGSIERVDALFACSLSVFDRSKGRSSITMESGRVSALELFDALDELAVEVIESMTGAHLGFGRLELANEGEAGDYKVFVDGMEIIREGESLPRVLAGRRSVRVVQARMFGDYEAARVELDIPEGGFARLEFSLPNLTGPEAEALRSAETAIETSLAAIHYDDPATSAAIAAFERLLTDSPAMATARKRIEVFKDRQTERRIRSRIEEAAWSPAAELAYELVPLYAKASRNDRSESLAQACEEDALLLAILLELSAGRHIAEGRSEAALDAYRGLLFLSPLVPRAYIATCIEASHRLGLYLQPERQPAEAIGASDPSLSETFGELISASQRFAELKTHDNEKDATILLPTAWNSGFRFEDSEYGKGPAVAEESGALAGSSSGQRRFVLVHMGFARNYPDRRDSRTAASSSPDAAQASTVPGPAAQTSPVPASEPLPELAPDEPAVADVARVAPPIASVPAPQYLSIGAFAWPVIGVDDVIVLGASMRLHSQKDPVGIELSIGFPSAQGEWDGVAFLPSFSLSSSWSKPFGLHSSFGLGLFWISDTFMAAPEFTLGFEMRARRLMLSIDAEAILSEVALIPGIRLMGSILFPGGNKKSSSSIVPYL